MDSKLLLAITLLVPISFASVLADSGQLSVVSGSTYHVDYKTNYVTIQSIQANKDSLSLDLSVLVTSTAASVEITMPRDLIDAKNSDGSDEVFIVLVDGTFATYKETSTTSQSRTILIQLSSDNKDVEIIGTSLGTTKLVSQNNTQQTTPISQKPTEQKTPQNQTVIILHPVQPVGKNNTQNTVASPDVFQQLKSMLNLDSSNLPLNLDKKQLTEYSIIAAIIIVIIIVITSSVKKNNQRKTKNN